MWIDLAISALALLLLFRLFRYRRSQAVLKLQRTSLSKTQSSFGWFVFLSIAFGLIWAGLKYSNLEEHNELGIPSFNFSSMLPADSEPEERVTIQNDICSILQMNVQEKIAYANEKNPVTSGGNEEIYFTFGREKKPYAFLFFKTTRPDFFWVLTDQVEYEQFFQGFASYKIKSNDSICKEIYKLQNGCFICKKGYVESVKAYSVLIAKTNPLKMKDEEK